jgi:hypothetical protein
LKIPITKKSAGGEAQGSSNPSTTRKPKKTNKNPSTIAVHETFKILI